jgi:predicted amidohydrolase YtcJ
MSGMKTLFYGGTIRTLASPQTAEALLAADGVIRAVGSRAELETPGCRRVDLAGRTLLPAFLDGHSHLSQTASALLQADLRGAKSAEEMGRRIRAFLAAQTLGAEEWAMASGAEFGALPAPLTLAELDAWVPERPLAVQSTAGHAGYLNSRGLAALGLTPQTPDPQGGVIGRSGGRLTGYLEETAWMENMRQIPPPGPERLLPAFDRAQALYASHGITLVQEGMLVEQMLPLYQMLLARGALWLDTVGYATPDALPGFARTFPDSVGRFDRHFCLGGVKIFLDGSPQGRTAWMRAPYEGEAEYRGYGTLSDAAVLAALETAARGGWQLLAHCNGDAAAEQFLRCLEQTERRFPQLRELRPVLIHGQLLGVDQLDAVKRLGVIPSFFAAHICHWGDVHVRNFGLSRAAHISPAGSALRRGIRFTFHQDTPVLPPDMPETLWCAVNRRTESGRVLGAEERIPPEAALRAVTENTACQYGLEGRRGVLVPGAAADFTVLDRDPLAVPPEELRDLRVEETYCASRRVWPR